MTSSNVVELRRPIRRFQDLQALNRDEILQGYLAGNVNAPCPPTASISWWHGWRNGRTDKGYAPIDEAQRALSRDVARCNGVQVDDDWGHDDVA